MTCIVLNRRDLDGGIDGANMAKWHARGASSRAPWLCDDDHPESSDIQSNSSHTR